MQQQTPPAGDPRPRSCWRGVLFRVGAILLGLTPLLACELALRAFGWGRPSAYEDPFVGFSAVHPLFVPDATGTRYEIARSRLTHFQPDSFPASKDPREFRIFVLGGSTVQGRPYSIETSFTTWLELALQAADPSRRWEVVNCGGVSYASYRLVPIMEELLAHQPDLFIFCEGHNEFLEDRTYGHIRRTNRAVSWAHEQLSRSRIYTLVRAAIQHFRAPATTEEAADRPTLKPEVDARLDWRRGMESYHRDMAWQRDVIEHFEFNLRRMTAIARNAGVPLVFVHPVSNLDWHPFKAEHRADLTPADREQFESAWDAARELYAVDPSRALAKLQEARAIDDQHAGIHYALGKCYQDLGLFPQAREELLLARDLDVCPLRMLSPMSEIMLRVADETSTPLVNADALFAGLGRGEIPGPPWLVDHVHPSIEGHQKLADAVADELARQGYVHPSDTWPAEREAAYRRHLESLPALYYVRAQERLTSEQGWAHGSSPRVKPK